MEISDLISIGVIKKVIGNGGIISAIPDYFFSRVLPYYSRAFYRLP